MTGPEAPAARPVRVLELYCGIGGCAAALAELDRETGVEAEVVAALDIDRRAVAVYGRSFEKPGGELVARVRNLEGISADELAGFRADLWWLSPPCQPFTRRGARRDDRDPRSRSLLRLIENLDERGARGDGPGHVALENVPGFRGSRVHGRLLEVLDRHGWRFREATLCPTELGVPNRRERWYLAASRTGEVGPIRPERATAWTGTLRDLLGDDCDRAFHPALRVEPELIHRYPHALDTVHPDARSRPTACFTAAYGRSPVRSGSYLELPEGGLRRFSPREVLHLLGFPANHTLPDDHPPEKAWPLAGNSLSVPAVKRVLAALPAFRPA